MADDDQVFNAATVLVRLAESSADYTPPNLPGITSDDPYNSLVATLQTDSNQSENDGAADSSYLGVSDDDRDTDMNMELDDDDEEDLGHLRTHNLQGILGNPEPESLVPVEAKNLHEDILTFIERHIPVHRRQSVVDYCRNHVPCLMGRRLATFILSTPRRVQVDLAIFMSEISNIVAKAEPYTMLNFWTFFQQSEVLTHWLSRLEPKVVEHIVGLPYSGQDLSFMLSGTCKVVNQVGPWPWPQLKIGEVPCILPPELPLRIKYLINRLSAGCQDDLIRLVITFSRRYSAELAAFLEIATPEVLQGIVNFLEELGDIDIDAYSEDNPDTSVCAYEPYNMLEGNGVVVPFILQLSDAELKPIWPGTNAAFHLVQQIARCEVAIYVEGSETVPDSFSSSPHTLIHTGRFRLDVRLPDLPLEGARVLAKWEVENFIRSLGVVPVETLAKGERNCLICTIRYERFSPESGIRELAVKIPCGHILGGNCLRKMLQRKTSGGAQQSQCPFCRAKIPVVIFSRRKENVDPAMEREQADRLGADVIDTWGAW